MGGGILDAMNAPTDGSFSQPDREILLAQIRESYGRVVYTHKTHEKQADLYFQKHRCQQRFFVGLTALSSGTFLVALLGLVVDEVWASLVTSFVALLISGVNLSVKTFQYGEETQKHRDAAAQVWNLRESYLSLITDLRAGTKTLDEARARRDQLQQQALEVYSAAPRTTSDAYGLAQKALKDNEELTFSESELDLLLPVKLRNQQDGKNNDSK